MAEALHPWLAPIWQGLRQRRNQLPHAMLLHGPQGTGKGQLARHLAAWLLCEQAGDAPCDRCQQCQLLQAGTHPDVQLLGQESRLGIDAVRSASQQLQGTAQQAAVKILVLEQVERMTESAANAFLKTLEEPPGDCFLILTSHALERVLPTIRSRCQLQPIKAPKPRDSLHWLQAQDIPAGDVRLALLFAASAPLTALALARDNQLDRCREFTRRLHTLYSAPEQVFPTAQWLAEQGDQAVHWLKCYFYHGLKLSAAGKLTANASMPNLAVAQWLTLIEQCHQLERQRFHSAGLNLALQLVPVLNSWTEKRNP